MLEFKDKNLRIIRLPEERIKHIVKHPEMQNKIYLIQETIENAELIEEDLYRTLIIYYYKYLKDEDKSLMIVVKLTNHRGYILTAYLVKK